MSNTPPGQTTPGLPPDAAECLAHFPLGRPPAIAADTFEIALALAGTASAGAYTAGVLDYLFEAMDAWSAARAAGDPEAPTHKVVISTIAGASGGGVNGAAMLRAAGFDTPRGADNDNPFYAAWIGDKPVALDDLLAKGQGLNGGAVTALNATPLIDKADRIVQLGIAPRKRDWLANPLRLVMTIGNLTGIPYRLALRGNTALGLDMMAHSDDVRFALAMPGSPARPGETPRRDEYALSAASTTNWDHLRDGALATCAFPGLFDVRPVPRTGDQLAYRAVLVPGDGAAMPDAVVPLLPIWGAVTVNPATAVDGGTMDNEPVGIARRALAGFGGRNARNADGADRAVVLVDPLASPKTQEKPAASLVELLPQLVNLFLYQARYQPEDLALALDETVYSRFLIAPSDRTAQGERALASDGLSGFRGFLDQRFMDHDFQLGRYNAFQFLTQDFRFPPNNPIIAASAWNAAYTSGVYAYPGQKPEEAGYLPMIPLMAALRANPPRLPVLPEVAIKDFSDAIGGRLDYVFGRLMTRLFVNWQGVSRYAAEKSLWAAWMLCVRDIARKWVNKRLHQEQ